MLTRRSGSASASSRNRTAFTTLKIAVLAPMARPRISTAAVVKRQSRTSRRRPWRASRTSASQPAVPRASRARFLDLLDAAEQPQRLESRLVARQAARLQALGLAFEMELQLFAQIGFAAGRGKRAIGAGCAGCARARMVYVLCNTRLTPADRRSHFATSASSCLRPALVSA